MSKSACAFAVLMFFVWSGAAFAQKDFVRDDTASDAVRLEETLRKETSQLVVDKSADDLRRDAIEAGATKPEDALADLAGAVSRDPKRGSRWLEFAKAAFTLRTDDASKRYTLLDRAMVAAYAAYQRAGDPDTEATALAFFAQVATEREMWRPALDAYRASLARKDDATIRATYEDVREKHGFRILDYKVDNEGTSPRVCFNFSESLQRGKIDFAPFVAVAGNTNAAVSADNQQLCVEGLAHGQRYAIVLRQGLPSAVGENLLKSADYEVYVKDRSPQVRFTGKNYVLPKVGQEGIPVVSVNTQRVDVKVFRIGDRNLLASVRSDDFLSQLGSEKARSIAENDGVKIWSGTLDVVGAELNKDTVTAFPVLEAVGKLEPGVYIMTARAASEAPKDEGSSETLATQWFVVSDLGLTAFTGADGVHALVRSLATAEPLAGVKIKLLARNNEVLATQATDADGNVRFEPGLSRGGGGLAPGLLVATDAEGDYGFLDLQQAAFDLTDRGVKGRAAPDKLDAFVFPERGVYRSGETVYVTTLLRDPKGVAVPGLPLTMVVKRPDGVEYKRTLVGDQGMGGRALVVPLLSGAATGTWHVSAYADPKGEAIGDATFLVEDYVPERLDVKLKPAQATLKSGEPAEIAVDAKYLYGAPGANLAVAGDVTVRASSSVAIPGLEGYSIGLADEPFENVSGELKDVATTDATGHAVVHATIPAVEAPKPVEAKIVLRVGEAGGRAVERTLTLPILPKGTSIAVKPDFGGQLSEGSLAKFDIVTLTAEGKRTPKPNISWALYQVRKDYQWFRSDGRWNYEPISSSKKTADGKIDVTAEDPAHVSARVGWGSYRLDVRSDDGEARQTSITFDVGWSGSATAQTPDLLDMRLDQASYKAGDTMKLRINSRFAGRTTIAIVSDKVESFHSVDLVKGENTIPVPVKGEWGAGAYAVALAHRPLDKAARRMPGRAMGVAWFRVDEAAHKLDVSIGGEAKVRPRGQMVVPIRITGLSAGEEAEVTVAAVDVGILSLTRYQPPSPTDYYFGQRQLATEVRDLYGLLIDGMQGTRGAIRSGGDGGDDSRHGPVPTQEPLARYSGVVKVKDDGTAEIAFDLPAFNGSVRVMAVAWSKTKVGNASTDVIVRDPVVVSGILPRFLSLGDQSRFFVEIDNVEGKPGDYTVDLDVHGPVVVAADATHKSIRLEGSGKTTLTIPVTAAGVGKAVIDLRLSGPGMDASQSFALGIETGSPELYRRTVRRLEPGGQLTVSSDLLGDFVPGTGSVSLAVSAFGAIDVPALLQALDRYPYGCSEQIVSRAMPLLYVNKLATMEQLALDGKIDDRVKDAITRVMARQDSSGAFGLWSAGSEDDLWLDAFVTDFLTRARERGFTVPQKGFEQALDHLRNQVVNASDIEAGKGEPLAYAVYVLARNGRPVMGDLRYLADTKLDAFKTPLARAQIAAALALLGDRGRSLSVFGSALDTLDQSKDDGLSRADYGSRLRDGAATMTLLAESGIGSESIVKASNVVADAKAAIAYTSTQEQAWMVLAAQALAKQTESMSLSVDGNTHKGSLYRTWRGRTLDARAVTIVNTSQAPVQMVVTTSGHPTAQEPAASKGYEVERTYYKLDGTKVDAAQVKQNDRMVVVLKVTETEAKYARLLLVDLLPAGLEIDNPNLVDGGSIEALSWLKKDVEPAHTEYRDDRFVAAFDRSASQSAFFSVAYVVRAVAPGRYVVPPATVEDMYRPDRYGRTSFGTLEVVAAKP